MQIKFLYYSILAEGLALGTLIINNIYGYLLFYLIHTIASLLISLFLHQFLPPHFRTKRNHFIITTTLIISATFIIGFISSIVVYLYVMRKQKDQELIPMIQISHKDYDDFPNIKRNFGEASATKLDGPKNYKIKLLSMISEFKTRDTLAVVQKGVSEEDDEVRLTSFSIINRFTSQINNIIKIKLDEYEKSTDELKKAEIAVELAKNYWELIYYGLSDKELEKYILFMIEKYTFFAININPDDPEISFLKGKLHLYKYELSSAEESFLNAINKGLEGEKVYPYLAEVYFYKKDFKKVKELIMEIAILERLDPRLFTIMKMWTQT
ncbi:MAG: hypothetical protein N3C60_06845 [Calditerrivibrio sp.]|nr:hypothetical protein [Calditerrivibrio sp.]